MVEQENECFEIVCDEGSNKWVIQQREKAIEWESKTNDCIHCECNNESGNIFWSKCNSSEHFFQMCVNEECVETEIVKEEKWIVEVEFDIDPSIIATLNTTELLETISEMTGIDLDDLSSGVDFDTEDDSWRMNLMANDEESAELIADTLQKCLLSREAT